MKLFTRLVADYLDLAKNLYRRKWRNLSLRIEDSSAIWDLVL